MGLSLFYLRVFGVTLAVLRGLYDAEDDTQTFLHPFPSSLPFLLSSLNHLSDPHFSLCNKGIRGQMLEAFGSTDTHRLAFLPKQVKIEGVGLEVGPSV